MKPQSCGAGGNRTPVRRAVAGSGTTIPDRSITDCVPSGRLPLRAPPDLSPVSAVFLAVSGLSQLSSSASVARLQRTGPACPRGGRSYLTDRSGDQAARSTGSSLPCLVVPRFWSLSNSGRVARFPVSTSKPISPLSMCGTPLYRPRATSVGADPSSPGSQRGSVRICCRPRQAVAVRAHCPVVVVRRYCAVVAVPVHYCHVPERRHDGSCGSKSLGGWDETAANESGPRYGHPPSAT